MKIVFLHAFPLDERMWQPQVDSLDRHESVALNLYRLGRSMEEWAEGVLAAVEGPFAACGASMGGYCALAIARLAPDRLQGLVLTGARVEADSDERRAARADTIALIRSAGPEGLWDDMGRKLFPETAPAEAVEQARRIALEQESEALVTAVEAIRDRPDSSMALAALPVPVLVTVGEADPFLSVEEAGATADLARDGRLHVFQGCGHLPGMERPDEFNRVLGDFLR